MYLTVATLRSMVGEVSDDRRAGQATIINTISLNLSEELQRVGIKNINQLTFFLALIIFDSELLSSTEDDTSQLALEAGLFSPRGLLKISGRENYRNFGDRLGVNFEASPWTVADPTIALKIAAEIWLVSYDGQIAIDETEAISSEFASRGRTFRKLDFDNCIARIGSILNTESNLVESPTSLTRAHKSTGSIFPVWYATNRRPTADGQSYSSERDNVTHFGRCEVYVPKSHKIGSMGSSLIKRMFSSDLIQIQTVKQLNENFYWKELQGLFRSGDDSKAAIVFFHGYNVSFESAAIRAAQIGYDLGAQRATAFFSWPSQATIGGYLADAATIEVSEEPIARFLVDFVERSGAQQVHLVAHSMGNRGLLRAISRIAARASMQTGTRFGQIILAAADVDADLFRQHAASYIALSQRTSIYISSRDVAVEASHWLHEFPRVGLTPPTLTVDGIDTIVVSNIDMSIIGHGYFSEARSVLTDLSQLIVHGFPPSMRFGLRERKADDGAVFWEVKA
jgi:esterase/lipase superfamily enzyme